VEVAMNQLHVQMVQSERAQAQVLIAENLAVAFIAEIHPNVVNNRIIMIDSYAGLVSRSIGYG